MTSLWLDRTDTLPSDPLPEDSVDEIVVGAGITGLVTALLLARAGRRVAVVEAREVGAVATGNTTAKISLLQGTKYTGLLRYQSKQVASAYVEANLEGQQWLLRFCEDHGVPVQRRAAVTYAADESEVSTVRKEHDAAASLGLDVRWEERLDVPFPNHGATVLEEQAQFDPLDFLHGRWPRSCASTAAPCTRATGSRACPCPVRPRSPWRTAPRCGPSTSSWRPGQSSSTGVSTSRRSSPSVPTRWPSTGRGAPAGDVPLRGLGLPLDP